MLLQMCAARQRLEYPTLKGVLWLLRLLEIRGDQQEMLSDHLAAGAAACRS